MVEYGETTMGTIIHDHHGHGEHGDVSKDMHIWLDPVNASAMVKVMMRSLIKIDETIGDFMRPTAQN